MNEKTHVAVHPRLPRLRRRRRARDDAALRPALGDQMPRTRSASAAASNGHSNGHSGDVASGGPPGGYKYRVIGARGRAALLKYKYTAVDRSLIAPYFQPFWTRVVTLIPTSVAPNLITTSGLALVVASSCLAWAYSPTLDTPLPTWVLLAHAGLVFTYQTLDAVDGKQVCRLQHALLSTAVGSCLTALHAGIWSGITPPSPRRSPDFHCCLSLQARRTGSSGPLGAFGDTPALLNCTRSGTTSNAGSHRLLPRLPLYRGAV